jgi:hypothetical protein
MEGKDKKKESIDEILSDLNGLLNKMPSILDGIKMPELQPLEAPKPRPEPEIERAPEPLPAESAQDADKTIILEPFSGLAEGAPEPAVEPAPAPEPEPEQPREALTPQSLGDFMFGQDAAPEPAAEPQAPAKLSGSALEPPQEKPFSAVPADGPSLAISEFTPPAADAPAQPQAALPAFDSTRDFGIPDIDALLQLSEGGQPAAEPKPEAGVIPSAVQDLEQGADAPSIQGLSGEMSAAAEVTTVENNEPPKEELNGLPSEQPAAQEEQAAEPQPQAASAFDAFAIDAAPAGGQPAGDAPAQELPVVDSGGEALWLEEPAPVQELPAADAGAETLQLDPASALPSPEAEGETLRLDVPAEPASAPGGITLSVEPAGPAPDQKFGAFQGFGEPQPEAAPAPAAEQPAASGGLELSSGLSLGSPQQEPAGADETLPGGSGVELGGGQSSSGEETLVVAPAQASSGDEEKTMIFQAAPSNTSRAQAGDLESLAAKTVPEGIPAERVRPMMFVYSMEDKALCATALAELDAICLKSATKPMFIKRAAVKECDPDVNPNFLQQSVAECGALGLVCLGNVPSEKVMEIEGVFSAANVFFRAYDSSSFNHSAALDLVTDLIVR